MNALDFLISHRWAVERSYLDGLIALAKGEPEARKMTDRQSERVATQDGAVAVIPVSGILTPKGDWLLQMVGIPDWGNMDRLGKVVTQAGDNPDVKLIALDFDTPGGRVAGATEFAAQVRAAREKKPVIAQINHMAASGGYWIASQATEIVTTPSGMAGAIGIRAIYKSRTPDEEEIIEVLSAGKYKGEGTGEKLSDETRNFFQSQIDEAYDAFVADVAAGRGVDEDMVRNGYGEGRSLTAKNALKSKMVDRIATLDETIARFVGKQTAAQSRRNALALARVL